MAREVLVGRNTLTFWTERGSVPSAISSMCRKDHLSVVSFGGRCNYSPERQRNHTKKPQWRFVSLELSVTLFP